VFGGGGRDFLCILVANSSASSTDTSRVASKSYLFPKDFKSVSVGCYIIIMAVGILYQQALFDGRRLHNELFLLSSSLRS